MKGLIINFWIGGLALLSLSLLGFRADEDQQAAYLLTASEQHLGALQDFSVHFTATLTHRGQQQAPQCSEGELRYRHGMYAIVTDQQEIYCDLASQWRVDRQAHRVAREPYDPHRDLVQNMLFLAYKQQEQARYVQRDTLHGVSCHQVQLDIHDPDVPYHKALVWIGADTPWIHKLALINRRQTTLVYTFDGWQVNQGWTKADFMLAP